MAKSTEEQNLAKIREDGPFDTIFGDPPKAVSKGGGGGHLRNAGNLEGNS